MLRKFTLQVKQGSQGGLWCSGLSTSTRNTPGYGHQQISHRKYCRKVVSTKDYCSSDADCLCHTHSFPQQVTLPSDKQTSLCSLPWPALLSPTQLIRGEFPLQIIKKWKIHPQEKATAMCSSNLLITLNSCYSSSLWELVFTFTDGFVQQLCFAFL